MQAITRLNPTQRHHTHTHIHTHAHTHTQHVYTYIHTLASLVHKLRKMSSKKFSKNLTEASY